MRRLVSLVLLGALALASGCSSSPSAATVDGSSITQNQLDSQLSLAAAPGPGGQAPTPENQFVQCALDIQGGGSLPAVTGVGDDTVTTQFAATTLESMVLENLEQSALARRHVGLTAADVSAAKADFISQLEESESQSGGSPCMLTGTQLIGRLPAAFLHQQAVSLAYQEELEEVVGHVNVGPAALMAYYRSHTANLTQVCLNLIITDTQAAAQTIQGQIAGGTTFPAASQGAGVDPESPSGGEVSCTYPSSIVATFGDTLAGTIDALGVGQLAMPLAWSTEDQSGAPVTLYVVVQMRQKQLVAFDQVSGAIRQVLLSQGSAVVNTTLNRLVARARISLDPRYGTWSAGKGVSVPTAPAPAFLLNRTVDQAAGSSAPGGLAGAG